MHRFILVLLILGWAVPALADPTISVVGSARQGNPIYVTVKGLPAGTQVTLHWGDAQYPMPAANDQGVSRRVVPVPVELAAGGHPMVADGGPGGTATRTVVVQHRWFPEQHITIPASTLAGYDTPQNKADDQKVIDTLKVFDPVQHWKGSFRWPVIARESTGFGERRLYNGWRRGWHKGIDLAAEPGAPIHAPAAGVVVLATRGLVNGNTVAINHGLGLGTVYFHMTRFVVKPGQAVQKGQVIGYVGGTGGFAPHLHWEARVDGVPVDPHTLFDIPAGWR